MTICTVCALCCQLHFMLCPSHEYVERKHQTTVQYVSNGYPSCTVAFTSSADFVTVKVNKTIFFFCSLVSTILRNAMCRKVCHNYASDQPIFFNSRSEIFSKFTCLHNIALMTSGCPFGLPAVG